MQQDEFRILIRGYKSGKGEYYIEEGFAKLFNISQEKAKTFFVDTPTTLKENMSFEEAEKYQKALANVGVDCEVENMKFNLGGLSLE